MLPQSDITAVTLLSMYFLGCCFTRRIAFKYSSLTWTELATRKWRYLYVD